MVGRGEPWLGLKENIPKEYTFAWGERLDGGLRLFWFEMDG